MAAERRRTEPREHVAARIEALRAPSLDALRPLKQDETDTFPVFAELPTVLIETEEHPDDIVRYVLAVCCGYAYGDKEAVTTMMARLGLEGNGCRVVGQYVDAMFIETTAFIVQSADGRVVIVCYRGTVPMGGISWLNDLDINPHRLPLTFPHEGATCDVHGGFYRNVRATRPDVINYLLQAQRGESVVDGSPTGKMEALYLTGHSFGGAQAALLAVMLRSEKAYGELLKALRAVYTYGAPMVGDHRLADACEHDPTLAGAVFRYVYKDDIVPQVPPSACGAFRHFGQEFRYTGTPGSWPASESRRQLRHVWDILPAPLSFITQQLPWTRELVRFHASLYDHLPTGYITELTPAGVSQEFDRQAPPGS